MAKYFCNFFSKIFLENFPEKIPTTVAITVQQYTAKKGSPMENRFFTQGHHNASQISFIKK